MARKSNAQKAAEAKAVEVAKQEELEQQQSEEGSETGTNTPNLEVTGVNVGEGNTSESEGSESVTETGSDAPPESAPEDNEELPVRDYSVESIQKVLVIDDDEFLSKRIAARLSNFCVIVNGTNDIEAMPSAANNMADIVSLINKGTSVQCIKILKGITEFINSDIKAHGNMSPFFGRKPFRVFLGGCPPACSFLEAVLRLAPTKTRKKTIKSFDPTALNKFLNEDKKELFISYFSE